MTIVKRILLFFVLPLIAFLMYPPDMLKGALPLIGVATVLFLLINWFLWRGNSTALTLSIFLQGMNVIIRLMMVMPNSNKMGTFNLAFVVFEILGLALSMYLMLRLDRVDVRSTMVT